VSGEREIDGQGGDAGDGRASRRLLPQVSGIASLGFYLSKRMWNDRLRFGGSRYQARPFHLRAAARRDGSHGRGDRLTTSGNLNMLNATVYETKAFLYLTEN
jgi:hypothetical protein